MSIRRPQPIRFTRGRHLYQIARSRTGDEGFIGMRDGRIIAQGPDPAWVVRLMITSSDQAVA
jgi:hypothetical protein